MDIKQKCGYILYFGKARKKLKTRYRKARPARGPIHKSPSSPEARKIQARNITNHLHLSLGVLPLTQVGKIFEIVTSKTQ